MLSITHYVRYRTDSGKFCDYKIQIILMHRISLQKESELHGLIADGIFYIQS